MRTRRAGSSERRAARTHAAAPPPAMTTSRLAELLDTARWRGAGPVRDRPRQEVVSRLVSAEEPLELIDHDPEEPGATRRVDARDVWRQEDVRQLADRRVDRDRLGIKDVERRDE